MMNLMHRLSPRAIGSGIKNRVSGLATRNGSPHAKILNGLTKLSKVAKETRFKKRKFCKFSATALLIISQNGINFLYQALDQMFKPVMHRRLNTPPLALDTAMDIDEMPDQAQEPEPPCIPTIIVTAPNGIVKELHMMPPWTHITRNYNAWCQSKQWQKSSLLHPYFLSRAQIAEMERLRREADEKERQRLEAEQAAALAQEQNSESKSEEVSTLANEQTQTSEGDKVSTIPQEQNQGLRSKMISASPQKENQGLKSKKIPSPSRNQSPSLKGPQTRPQTPPLPREQPEPLSIKRSHAEWKARELRKKEQALSLEQPRTPAQKREQPEALPIKRYYAECKAKEQLQQKEREVTPLQKKDQNQALKRQQASPQKQEQSGEMSIKRRHSKCKARGELRKQNQPEADPEERAYPEFKPLSFPPFRYQQRLQARASTRHPQFT
ncbi:uncharacterized protein TrAFT101_003012 [Trichoderma asperellum]|uniref:Uncharacterized protein n=1 Tax=Trichoderma asperellum (strain ATCC 204424 / CBS 433.97 / NBRC 101777) TaxID=1042311 RepID=A0A2T3ZI40_TRIA4|nr:hypothetical protein M441DRAFT_349365 [Trichoderma asperellum CBS 433.97]PTB44462.1 hypothetical protein M441DRAFT_349365 [Trichoderma asperellum CBS 433.97]UKZ87207.1 hypothetical protein TrAFT101_003012 [Trichoderma asperellum]